MSHSFPQEGSIMTSLNHAAEIIKKVLLSREPRRIRVSGNSLRHAGVLIPLFEKKEDILVLFTKRTNTVEHHKGQISFPGGAVDKGDASYQETALRETREEIGLPEEFIDILGPIDDTLTLVSSFLIHPFVGIVKSGCSYSLNPAEVKRVLEVPLSVFHPRYATIKNYTFEHEGRSFQAPGYAHEGNVIWGATARIIDNFMQILGEKIPLPPPKK